MHLIAETGLEPARSGITTPESLPLLHSAEKPANAIKQRQGTFFLLRLEKTFIFCARESNPWKPAAKKNKLQSKQINDWSLNMLKSISASESLKSTC